MAGAFKLLSVDGGVATFQDGLQYIESLRGELTIVVMIGDGRAGKSFLANKIANVEVFSHAPTPEAVTAGIDLFAVPHKRGHLLLWDCEGGNNALASTHQMVNVLGMVAASKIVYVVGGMASDAAFDTLERNFASRDLVMQGQVIEDQEFLFLVNKNTLTYENHHFSTMLTDRKRPAIAALYPEEQRQFLTLGFEGSASFDQELQNLLGSIHNSKPRMLAGLQMGGPQLADLLRLVFEGFKDRGHVEMPAMARVVIYDNYLRPLINETVKAFKGSLPRDVCVPDDEIDRIDTRRSRLNAFAQNTSHISPVYGDFTREARQEIVTEFNDAWDAFSRRNDELGEMIVKTWSATHAPFSHTKTTEGYNFLGQKKQMYVDVHDVQTRVVSLHANGSLTYGEWETVAQEERNKRDKPERVEEEAIYADLETDSNTWLSKMMRKLDHFFSGGIEGHDDGEGFASSPRARTLHDAAYRGDVERVRELLDAGKNINEKIELALMTPLHQAARKGHHDVVRVLLAHKSPPAEVNAQDSWLGTALHAACSEGHLRVVQELLTAPSVEVGVLNHFEQSPLDLAVKYNRADVIQLLRARLRSDNN
eukprot:GEMP01017418.1.p1 GENE.GEMP01017418.1~~GEMP01017418.1.p1  ORF type:complete len:593 (+),score=201.58 GEMP01017418.1:266-2044(+)